MLNEETKKEDCVAEIIVTVFDDYLCLKDNISPTEAALAKGEEEFEAFSALFKSEDFKNKVEDTPQDLLDSCYLNRFYIHPKFRNKGIGTFLKNNLFDLLEAHFLREFQAIVVFPYPTAIRDFPLTKKAWKEMDVKLKRCLVNADFEELNDKKHYIKIIDYDKEILYNSDQYTLVFGEKEKGG